MLRADRRNPHVRERQVQVLGRRGQRSRVGAVEVRAVLARALERSNDTAPMEGEASASSRSCWSFSRAERVRSGESVRLS